MCDDTLLRGDEAPWRGIDLGWIVIESARKNECSWSWMHTDFSSSVAMLLGLARNKEHYMHIVCIHSISQYTQKSRVEKRTIIRDEPFE